MEKADKKKSVEKMEKLDKKKSAEVLEKMDKKRSSERLDRLDKERNKSESGDSTGDPREDDNDGSMMSRFESGRFSLRKSRPQSSSSFHEYVPDRRVPLKDRLKTQEEEMTVVSPEPGKDR